MQVLPVTAQLVSRNRGVPYTRAALNDPPYNLEYGQSFIEMMRGNSATAGQLPRVIASYNAGPLPVARWATINDKGDPLLWIEVDPLLGDALLCSRGAAEHVGLSGSQPRGHADPEGDGRAPLADVPDQHDADVATSRSRTQRPAPGSSQDLAGRARRVRWRRRRRWWRSRTNRSRQDHRTIGASLGRWRFGRRRRWGRRGGGRDRRRSGGELKW